MAIIDTIKVERYLIAWHDLPEEKFYARFGILETPEQELALNEGLENQDPEWIDFDENIFYWINAYTGETIEEHTKEMPLNDFYYAEEKGFLMPKALWEVGNGEDRFVSCVDCTYKHLMDLYDKGEITPKPVYDENYISDCDNFWATEDFFGEHADCEDCAKCSSCNIEIGK